MAKKRRKALADFDTFSSKETEQSNETKKLNSYNEQKNEYQNNSEKLNSENEQKNGTESLHSLSKQLNEIEKQNREQKNKKKHESFMSLYAEESKSPRVEDTHTRDTYLIRSDLLQRFNKLAKGQKKGFKMRFINYVLEKELDNIEKSKFSQ